MIRSLFSLYSWRYPVVLVALLRSRRYRPFQYLKVYWQTTDFSPASPTLLASFDQPARNLLKMVQIGMLLQVFAGGLLMGLGYWNQLPGGWLFGLAVVLAYPVLWAHFVVLLAPLRSLRLKTVGKAFLCVLLEAQVRRLRRRHSFKVVSVSGSIGKTSTKLAVATVLQAKYRVRSQEGNYNDRLTVPLIFFGHTEPGLFNVLAWAKLLLQNERIIRRSYPFDVVVVELGTDGPGFMAEFAYVQPDLALVTAITPEHMEFFGSLEAVAREELAVLEYARQVLINTDDTPAAFLERKKKYQSYGLTKTADYQAAVIASDGLDGQQVRLRLGADTTLTVRISLLGEQGLKVALAAAAAAKCLGMSEAEVAEGLGRVKAFAGRMQILPGIKGSTLIDDTYNASPVAVKAALEVLQRAKAPQRIAIIGSMNELGDYSPQAHNEIAGYCDPKALNLVVAFGADAVEHFAPVAKARGCKVETFLSPYEAGAYVRKQLQAGAVVLAKGSQGGIFAEEALKSLLANKADEAKLTRQSAYWMAIKRKHFPPSP